MKLTIASHMGAKRPRYFPARMLTAEDLELEQQYVNGQLRRLTRATLGTGVVEGLAISTSESTISVLPGLAVDPLGQLIELTESSAATLPAASGAWDVFVKLDHEPCDPILALAFDDESRQEPSMLCDVIRVWLEDAQPASAHLGGDSAVWLGRVRAIRGAIEIECAKRRARVVAAD